MLTQHPFVDNFAMPGAFALAIVDTVREPFLVLDQDLRVLAASRSFYSAFKVSLDDTQGRLLYALGDGQWDIPKLHLLLEKIVPEHGVMEGYEVEHEFPGVGQRTMLLNARKVFYEGGSQHHHSARHRGCDRAAACAGAPPRRTSCCDRRRCCSRNCSTVSPTACRSSPASS